VHVIYGSANGLDTSTRQVWSQDTSGIDETAEAGDTFGWSLVAANLGLGPQSDLAIGVPNETLGAADGAGVVHVLYGSPTGLTAANSQLWSQDLTGTDAVEADDGFGWALSAADFGKTGQADLAIGVPGENASFVPGAGAVNVLYGSTTGLTATGAQLWHQDVAGVPEKAENGNNFGLVLAAGNFGKSKQADLAVGVFKESVGTVAEAGAVNVLYGRSAGLGALGSQLWHQNSAGIASGSRTNENFGFALVAANFGKSSQADLAVGVPYENANVDDDGAVNVLYGGSTGLSAVGDQFWHQGSPGVGGAPEIADFFGQTLAAANFGKSSQADLAVGIPLEDVGVVQNAGALTVLYGRAAGLSSLGDQIWHQDRTGIPDGGETGDQFSQTLAPRR
jgi:hypothetical protein